MSMKCSVCREEGTVFFIKPGGAYLCPDCKKLERAEERKDKEEK
jgi:uncharacterized protein YlaI